MKSNHLPQIIISGFLACVELVLTVYCAYNSMADEVLCNIIGLIIFLAIFIYYITYPKRD
jgi:hypothetical protein